MINLKTRLFAFAMLAIVFAPLGFGQASEPADTGPLTLNPATGCMEGVFTANQPDTERTVPAAAVIESLRGNSCLRLDHAIIRDDVDLRTLPVNGISSSGHDMIRVEGAFVVANSVFEGALLAGRSQTTPQVAFDGPAVFSNTQFGGLDFTGVHFGTDAHFENTTFSESAKLDQIEFSKNAYFNNVSFEKPVFMNRISVGGALDLSQSSFASLVRGFGLTAHTLLLTGANFHTTTDFSSATLTDLDAFQTVFEQNIDFKNGTWDGGVNFEQTKFLGNGDFSDVVFGGRQANFKSATFEKNAAFARAKFFGQADFTKVKFMLNAIFNSAEFYQQALFKQISSGLLFRLLQTKFFQLADFGHASFVGIEMMGATFFNTPPNWQAATFEGEIKLEGMTSYTKWHTNDDGLNQALMNEPYQVFSSVDMSKDVEKPDMTQLMLIGTLAGIVAVLALLLFN